MASVQASTQWYVPLVAQNVDTQFICSWDSENQYSVQYAPNKQAYPLLEQEFFRKAQDVVNSMQIAVGNMAYSNEQQFFCLISRTAERTIEMCFRTKQQ